MVKAWLEGDWDVVAGAFFDCWQRDKHVIQPFTIPTDWTRFLSFDWGSAKPFSVGWWAVSDGSILPRGALIRYREWYGASEPNVGLKLFAEQVADGILDRERKAGERRGPDRTPEIAWITGGIADPACWKVDGGPSVAERMARSGVFFGKADNSRINGWDQVRQRLIGEDGEPMMYIFSNCVDTIRTLPLMQHDDNRPEDIDSDMEDHAVDEIRYACMSRPLVRKTVKKEPMKLQHEYTMNDLIKASDMAQPRKGRI